MITRIMQILLWSIIYSCLVGCYEYGIYGNNENIMTAKDIKFHNHPYSTVNPLGSNWYELEELMDEFRMPVHVLAKSKSIPRVKELQYSQKGGDLFIWCYEKNGMLYILSEKRITRGTVY